MQLKNTVDPIFSKRHCNIAIPKLREVFWIEFYNSTDPTVGYNITIGGSGGDTLSRHPDHDLIVEKMKSVWRKPHSESTRQKISKSNSGRPKSPEHRLKLALAQTGKKASEETRRKLSASHVGLVDGPKNPMYGKRPWNYGLKTKSGIVREKAGVKVRREGNGRYVPLKPEVVSEMVRMYSTGLGIRKIRDVINESFNLSVSNSMIINRLKYNGVTLRKLLTTPPSLDKVSKQ